MDISQISFSPPVARDLPAPSSGVASGGNGSGPSGVGAAVSMPGFSQTGDVNAVADKAKAPASKTLDMKAALAQANQMIQQSSTSLEFQVDPASKETVVRMVDINSKEVIKQFPSEEFLRMASVVDSLQKQLVNEKV